VPPEPIPYRALPYYADTEDGGYLEDAGHVELLGMLEDLNSTDNTFFVVYPDDEDLDWSIAVHTRPGVLGGYEIERRDPTTGRSAAVLRFRPRSCGRAGLYAGFCSRAGLPPRGRRSSI
jgi:hypothetical protein